MKKRVISLLLIFAVCFSFAGCSSNTEEKVSERVTEKEEKTEEKSGFSSIEEAIGSIKNVVSIKETQRENPEYYPELKSYSLVYDTDNGTMEVFVLAPEDAISQNYGAVIWCPDAKITDYRFAQVADSGYIVFAVYRRGYEGSQSEGVRDFGGDKDLQDMEVLLDIIIECDFINRFNIISVSGVEGCIKSARLLATEKGREYISGVAFAQPLADFNDYFENYNSEYKDQFADHITSGDPEKLDEEISKRNMLEIIEGIGDTTDIYIASFGEGNESVTPTGYSDSLREKLDEMGIFYDTYHFDYPGTDFYTQETIALLCDWLYLRFQK